VTLDSSELVRVNAASGQVDTVAAGLFHPTGIALLPSGTEALVNNGGGWLWRVNLTTGATTGFETGALQSLALALDPTGSKAFVSDFMLPHLRMVDVATGQVREENVLHRITDIVIGASNTHAYVLWRWLGQIAVMDLDTWEATPIFDALLNPTGVALNASETHAYVLERQTGELSRMALDPIAPDYGRPVRVTSFGILDFGGGSLALGADETWALVVHEGDDEPNLLRVDLTTGLTSTVTSVPLGKLQGVALSPDDQFAYVTAHATVQRVDLATGDVTQVGDPDVYQRRLNGAALTADGRTLYIAQRDLHRLLGVDVTTGEVMTVTSDLHLPVAVALNSSDTAAWVLEEGRGGALTQVDLASGEQLAVMRLQWWITSYATDRFATGRTGSLAVTADETTAYVAMVAPGPRYLFRVDLTGSSNVRLLYQPPMLDVQDVALNEAETRAYLLDRASYTLFQLDMDPTSPTSGTLSALVDGRIAQGRQVALSSDEGTLVVAYEEGLMQIRASDGVILKSQWIGPFRINGLALHPAQSIAYVTADDGSLRAVDLSAEEGSTVIASGLDDPTGVVLNGGGTVAYLVERNAGRLVTVTLSTGAVDTVATGLLPSRDVALDEVDGVAHVLGDDVEDNPRIAKVDLATGAVEWALSGAYGGSATAAIALSQDRQHLYVARNITGALWRVDLAEAAAAAIPPSTGYHPVGYHPEPVYEEMEKQQGAALSADGQRLYLGNEFTPRLLSLDLSTGRVRLVTGMDWALWDVAVTPDEHMLYVTRQHTNGLIEINLETGETRMVWAEHSGGNVVLDPTDTNFAFVTYLFEGQVCRLNLTTGARTVLPVQLEPDFAHLQWPVAVNAAATHVYLVAWVGELGDYALVRFDLTTNQTTTVAVVESQGDWIASMIVDQAEQYAYVSEQGAGFGGARGGAVRRVDIDPTSPTYGQVEVVVPDVGEIFPLALDPTGSRLIVGGGCTNVIFEVD